MNFVFFFAFNEYILVLDHAGAGDVCNNNKNLGIYLHAHIHRHTYTIGICIYIYI